MASKGGKPPKDNRKLSRKQSANYRNQMAQKARRDGGGGASEGTIVFCTICCREGELRHGFIGWHLRRIDKK
jgi:hypothetical protein